MRAKYIEQDFKPIEILVTIQTEEEYETLLRAYEQLFPSRIDECYVDSEARQMIYDLIGCIAGSAKGKY